MIVLPLYGRLTYQSTGNSWSCTSLALLLTLEVFKQILYYDDIESTSTGQIKMYKVVNSRGETVSSKIYTFHEALQVRESWERNYPQIGKLQVVRS